MSRDVFEEPERESIWSVPKGAQRWFLLLFFSQLLLALCVLPLASVPMDIWKGLAPVILPAAALSLVAVETGRALMVIAEGILEWRRKRERKRTQAAIRKVLDEIEKSAKSGPEELDETLRQIKERFKCLECSGTGLKDGNPCLGCGGLGGAPPTKAIIRGP